MTKEYILIFTGIGIPSISRVSHQCPKYLINFSWVFHMTSAFSEMILPFSPRLRPPIFPGSAAARATAPGWTGRSSRSRRRTRSQRSGDAGSPKSPTECHPRGILGWAWLSLWILVWNYIICVYVYIYIYPSLYNSNTYIYIYTYVHDIVNYDKVRYIISMEDLLERFDCQRVRIGFVKIRNLLYTSNKHVCISYKYR